MAAIIIASLVLIGIEIAFSLKRPDPKQTFMLDLYERMSENSESRPPKVGPGLSHAA